jgi:hypothetical protein
MDVPWTDEWQVFLLAGQLLVLVAAAIFAWRQVEEARELRNEQNRPFVVVDFDVDGGYLIYLEVMNLGTSLARDVKIEIDPPLESAIDIEIGKLKMLNEGIATLAPGKKYRAFFDMGFRRHEDPSDLPMNYIAKVSYTDEKRKRPFEETLNLDLDQYMEIQTVTRHGLHDIYGQLDKIRKVLEKWSWSGGSGLIAMTPTESREEGARMREAMEERRQRLEQNQAEANSGD